LLRKAEGAPDSPSGLPALAAVRTAAPEERPRLLDALLRDKVARLLGASPARLDGDRPLLQLGLDSLMAVELRNWVEGELRVNLPIVELMRSPSLSRLSELLLASIREAGAGRAGWEDSVAAPPEACFPLAHGQRGLWFLHQTDGTKAACNICFSYRV